MPPVPPVGPNLDAKIELTLYGTEFIDHRLIAYIVKADMIASYLDLYESAMICFFEMSPDGVSEHLHDILLVLAERCLIGYDPYVLAWWSDYETESY